MKTKAFFVLTAAGFLLTSVPVIAKDKGKSHKNDAAASPAADGKAQSAGPAAANANDHKEPWANVNVTIGNGEKEQIREYVRNCEIPHKGRKNKGLPPGLAKKAIPCVPPGQAKKLYNVGQRFPAGYGSALGYNQIPYDLRSQYGLNPYGNYYYGDGYLYRVNPRTMLIQQVVAALLR